MIQDYGFRAEPRLGRWAKIALLCGCGVAFCMTAWILGAGFIRARMLNLTDLAAYGAAGLPCPQTTPARLAVEGPQMREVFQYGGMLLHHAFGEADCAWVSDDNGLGFARIPICRFTSPGALEVQADGRSLLFAPGIGRSATILRRRGEVLCIMTARSMVVN